MCADEIKRIDIKEFMEFGFLQEVNRQFFHPLGLALEVIIDDEDGSMSLGGIWDYRGDPEGNAFGNDIIKGENAKKKAIRVQTLFEEKSRIRIANFGWVVQPIGEEGCIQPDKPIKLI